MARVRRVALLAAVAVVAACGGGDKGGGSTTFDYGDGRVSSTTAATATTEGSGGGPPTTSGEGSGGSGTTMAPTGTAPPTTTGPTAAVIPVGSLRVGGVAPALLRPGRGDKVVLEVRAQSGAAPAPATIDHLVRVLRDASGKEVLVDGVDALDGGARDWSADQILDVTRAAAQIESGRRQVVLRLLFLRGTYRGDTGVLGVAVAGDVAAVFSDQVDATAGLLVAPAVVEDAVSMHELGHLLGLVNLVLDTGRDDPEHAGHSRNRRSVMYWQVESNLVTQLLDGGIPRDFDADDRAELAAIRGG